MLLLSFIAVVLKIVKTEKEYSLQSLFLNAYMLPEVKKTQMRVCARELREIHLQKQYVLFNVFVKKSGKQLN